MFQIHAEQKRARVPQMWLRTGSDRSKRTEPYVMILAEARTAADGVLLREHSDFGRCGSAILRFSTPRIQLPAVVLDHSHLHGLTTAIHEKSGLAPSYHIVVECEVFRRFLLEKYTDFTFLWK